MDEEFNWLEYSESIEAAAQQDEARSGRPGLRRFLPSLPGLPRLSIGLSLPRIPRPRLPSLPSMRRRPSASSQPSAADLLGGQQERPLDDLDERLRALRERSAGAPPAAPANQALYDVDDILTSPELQSKPGGVISAAALFQAQQRQVEMLRDIVGGSQQPQQAGGRYLPAFSLRAAPRLLGAALLMLVVCLPFVSSDYAEGELPPADFDEDRPGPATFYNVLDNVTGDDFILVAFEYGPSAAGELDLLADLLLRHIFAQRATPLIVSSNPIAIVHAQNIIRGINRSLAGADAQLLHGQDYFLLRYLPGGALGLRELRENFADVLRISAKGLPTGLKFETLAQMTEILLIAESADAVRNWIEQVLPLTGAPRLLLATGQAAQPLAQAYADSLAPVIGPVYSIRDAFTYGQKLALDFGGLPPGQPEARPELDQLPAIVAPDSQAQLPLPTESAADAAGPTAPPQPTATTPPTATPFLTATPLPTDTPTPLPTDTPAPTATEATIRAVEVITDQSVNIRRGPTTVDEIVGLGYKGDLFEVVGANGDGSWLNILLPGGVNAWIAAFLVEERLVTASEFAGAQARAAADTPPGRALLQLDFTLRLGKNQPRFSQAQAPAPSGGVRPELILSRDRALEIPRLQAMTLGTLAAVLVIVFGNTIYAARGLMRWRDSQGG